MVKTNIILGFIGTLLTLYGLISAITGMNVFWYGGFVIGLSFLFGSINLSQNNETLFNKPRKYLIKLYSIFLVIGIVIEFVGRFVLGLWAAHESLNYPIQIFEVFLIAYPFAFFSIYESFILLRNYLNSNLLTFIIIYLFTTFAHEVPNTFVWEWIYKIPYIKFEILQVNIVIIVGWLILIAIPITTKNILEDTKFTKHKKSS